MQEKIVIIKNVTRESPISFEHFLAERNIPFKIVDLEKNESIENIQKLKAIVLLGGPDSANDETPKVKEAIKIAQDSLNREIPFLGVCLGLQILTKAAGGEVVKCPGNEIGIKDQNGEHYTINLTQEGKTDPLLNDLPESLKIFQLHKEKIIRTPEMKLLATSRDCQNQLVKVDLRSYGFQGHFELTKELFEEWRSSLPELSNFDQNLLQKQFLDFSEEYFKNASNIYSNFLKIAGLS